ncbi:MAG: hypothetical protein H0V93_01420 [Euzebyales bacterium]|nr:hypothetical protein [Euzebyales bacterium]
MSPQAGRRAVERLRDRRRQASLNCKHVLRAGVDLVLDRRTSDQDVLDAVPVERGNDDCRIERSVGVAAHPGRGGPPLEVRTVTRAQFAIVASRSLI